MPTSAQWPTLYKGHPAEWTPLYNGPLLGRQSIDSCLSLSTNGPFLLPPRWSLQRVSTVTVLNRALLIHHQRKAEKKFSSHQLLYLTFQISPCLCLIYKNDKFDTRLSHLWIQCIFPGPLRHTCTALFQDFLKSTMHLSMPIMRR